ncbi:MAG: hypothetical protein ACE5EO_02910, partial [Candidatus Krumholzibacteriia bacterium]
MVTMPQLKCDRRVLLIVIFLMVIGASLVASASSHFSASRFDDPYFLLKRHQAEGVNVHLGRMLTEIHGRDRVLAVSMDNGKLIDTDL